MVRNRPKVCPKLLLVEGKKDVRVIPELIEANGIKWEQDKKPIVWIEDCGGYTELIKPDVIATELQTRGLSKLGIMIDADDYPEQRWQSIRNICLKSIPSLPESLPETGLIHRSKIEATGNEINFGIWMMPDNKMRGMLETFLTYLLPDGNEFLWEYAQKVTTEAKNKGAIFKEVHRDKANIYTWLAWQNEPGAQLHEAIKEKIFNPNHPKAQNFVDWFKKLYFFS